MNKFLLVPLISLFLFACAQKPVDEKQPTHEQFGADKESIRHTMRENLPRFRVCYERAMAANPSAQGKVVVGFLYGDDGVVKKSQIVSAPAGMGADTSFGKCMLKTLNELKFPPGPKGAEVEIKAYPFVFEHR